MQEYRAALKRAHPHTHTRLQKLQVNPSDILICIFPRIGERLRPFSIRVSHPVNPARVDQIQACLQATKCHSSIFFFIQSLFFLDSLMELFPTPHLQCTQNFKHRQTFLERSPQPSSSSQYQASALGNTSNSCWYLKVFLSVSSSTCSSLYITTYLLG